MSVIPVPNRLKAKLGDLPPPGDEIAAAADRAMSVVGRRFAAWALEDAETLACAAAALARGDASALDVVRRAAFDLSGQAGGYGFALAARMAASLVRLLELDPRDERARALAMAHAAAVLAAIRDPNAASGPALAAELEAQVAEAIGRVST